MSNKKKDKSNIVFFTDSYYPLDDSSSQINTSIARYISKHIETTIVCTKSIFSSEPIIYRESENLYIRKLPTPFVNSRSIPLKLFKFISFSLITMLYLLLKRRKKSIYIIHTSPPVSIPFILNVVNIMNIINGNHRKKLLLAHDIYPDIIGDLRRNLIGKYIYKILDRTFLESYKKFDYVIACCEPIKTILTKKYKLPPEKIDVVNNWSLVDSSLLKAIDPPFYNNDFNIQLLLTGNVGKLHLYKETAEIIRNILIKSEKLKILKMYTRGAHYLDIYNLLKDLKNVNLYKTIPPNDLIKVYKKPSITIVPLTHTATKCAFPSRVSTALSLGSPILAITDCSKNNFLTDFINEFNLGVCITTDDINKSCSISKNLEQNFNIYRNNCLDLYKSEFSRDSGLMKILNGIKKFS